MKQSSRVALVTGVSSGMGRAFAQVLLGKGMIVCAVARRVDQMTELRRLGAITLAMDITSEQYGASGCPDQKSARFGRCASE